MPDKHIFLLTMLAFGLVFVVMGRFNIRSQKAFMARTSENAEKLAQQRAQTQELITRQTAALERIATALERGKA